MYTAEPISVEALIEALRNAPPDAKVRLIVGNENAELGYSEINLNLSNGVVYLGRFT